MRLVSRVDGEDSDSGIRCVGCGQDRCGADHLAWCLYTLCRRGRAFKGNILSFLIINIIFHISPGYTNTDFSLLAIE